MLWSEMSYLHYKEKDSFRIDELWDERDENKSNYDGFEDDLEELWEEK